MEPDNRYPQVYTVGGIPNLTHYPNAPMYPVMVPTLKKRRRDWQKVCTVVILILTFIALASLALGVVCLLKLQNQLDKIKQGQEDEGQQAKLTGPVEITKPPKIAAHLTGMNFMRNSRTLVWEAIKGHAFTKGVHYKDKGLIIDEAGHFFIYSKVFFRGQECKSDMLLEQTVFKRTDRYPKDLTLMVTRSNTYCAVNSREWSKSSFQAGIFKLFKGEHIYVNVSNPDLVNFDESNTFFGLHKL
ncbi:tumor necrosis factor ligand superfamily member 6-like [Heptranchias perlo]|uniref:tumor necrosis factor ligand superfamily member 6-like n=1 Tax=Heptranchias perlo TaxID=212740 RepID=UPI003559E4CD